MSSDETRQRTSGQPEAPVLRGGAPSRAAFAAIAKRWAAPALILLALGSAYRGSHSNYLTEDSMAYANSIISGKALIHPHHLLYNGLMRGFVLLFANGPVNPDRAIVVMQTVNIVVSILTAMVVALIVTALGGGSVAGTGFALLFGLASGFCAYSSQNEVYNLTCLFLTLAVWGMLRGGRIGTALTGIGYAMAMFFHQTAVFLGFAIAFYALFGAKKEGRLARLAVTGFLPVAFVGVVYALIGRYQGYRNLSQLYVWLTSYAQLDVWGKGNLSAASFLSSWAGFRGACLDLKTTSLIVAYFISLALFAVGALVFCPKHAQANNRLIAAMTAWFLPLAAFNTWWCGGNPEFWIVATIPVVATLAALSHGAYRYHHRVAVRLAGYGCIGACIALEMYSYYGRWIRNRQPNAHILTAKECAEVTRDGDTVFAVGSDWCQYYRVYLCGRKVTPISINSDFADHALQTAAPTSFTAALFQSFCETVDRVRAKGGRVFVDQGMARGQLPTSRRLRYMDPPAFARSLQDRFALVPARGSEPDWVYEVVPREPITSDTLQSE